MPRKRGSVNTCAGAHGSDSWVSPNSCSGERAALDRTFIDRNDVRWIVDYKTDTHEGGDLEEFLGREQERYRKQLEQYAALIKMLDGREIKLGLYFPLLKGWREWSPSTA